MPLDSLQISLQIANATMFAASGNLTKVMSDPTSTPQAQAAAVQALSDAETAVMTARTAWRMRAP